VKKLLSIFITLITFSTSVECQGLFNNGALIVIQSGALVKVDGDANGNYLNTTSGTNGRIDINGNMEVDGNWTNNAGNNVFININTNGTVKLVGTTQQDVGGSAFTDFENLTLNNAAGARMTVNNNRVNGNLTLTTGALRLNSNTLIENNTSASSIVRDGVTYIGYIVSETLDGTPNTELSRLQWNIGTAAAGNTFTIPFGKADASYIPFSATITTAGTGAGNLTAATYPTSTSNTPYAAYPNTVTTMSGGVPLIADNSAKVIDRFWGITWNGFATNPTATLSFTYAVAELNSLTPANLQAQYWDNALSPAGWNSTLSGSGASYIVSGVGGINISRVWTLVDKTNPLPIELLSFNAVCDGKNVNLNWSTASETNNDFFTVERSMDASNWEDVLNVNGAGNSSTANYYNASDNQPLPGNSFYRLKQTDYDGTFTYSGIVPVGCTDEATSFSLISAHQGQQQNEIVLTFSATQGEHYSYNVFDDRGRLIENESGVAVEGYNELHIISIGVSQGIYMITLQNSEKYFNQKILLK
jgi:hypothetical protein